jgi:hypothetical protein
MVVNSAQKAIDNANAQGSCDPGYCLKYTRGWLGIASKESDAADAWKNAIGKHPGDKNPPDGAPVFWTGGSSGHGHIALVRKSDMRTTDKPTGKVGNDDGAYPRSQWGLSYAGWAEGFNGVRIPYLGVEDWRASGDVYVSKLKLGQKDSESVSRLRYRLDNHAKIPEGRRCGSGTTDQSTGADYGPEVADASKWWMQNIYSESHGTGENWSNQQANQLFGDHYNVIEE